VLTNVKSEFGKSITFVNTANRPQSLAGQDQGGASAAPLPPSKASTDASGVVPNWFGVFVLLGFAFACNARIGHIVILLIGSMPCAARLSWLL
jgi:hypothetical protein